MEKRTLVYVLVLAAVGVAIYYFWKNQTPAGAYPTLAGASNSTPTGIRSSVFGQTNPAPATGFLTGLANIFDNHASASNSPLLAGSVPATPSAPISSASDFTSFDAGGPSIALEPVPIPTTLTDPSFSSYASLDSSGNTSIVSGVTSDTTDSMDESYFG